MTWVEQVIECCGILLLLGVTWFYVDWRKHR